MVAGCVSSTTAATRAALGVAAQGTGVAGKCVGIVRKAIDCAAACAGNIREVGVFCGVCIYISPATGITGTASQVTALT